MFECQRCHTVAVHADAVDKVGDMLHRQRENMRSEAQATGPGFVYAITATAPASSPVVALQGEPLARSALSSE